jgi:hypothetical protein
MVKVHFCGHVLIHRRLVHEGLKEENRIRYSKILRRKDC